MGNTNNKPNEDSGGSKTSGLAKFLEDPICVRLCQEYQDGKIPTKQELFERLLENGKKISMSTLKNYLKEINEATSQIGPFAHTKGHVLEWERSFTKFGKEKSIILGTTGRNDWRRFRCDKSDVKNNVEYFRCNSCDARAIIRNGELQKSYLIRHNLNCLGQPRAKFIAKDIDREARKQLREGWHEKPKSIWREAYEIAQKIDVENDVNERDAYSVSRNFPNWNKVRSGYNKSRQQGIGDCDDPYNLPETLKVTNFGSIRLKMDKIVTDEHRIMQLQIVSDGTFRKVRNNIDRLFDKNLTDLIRGIRNNKENEARYIANCIEEIKTELRQDSTFIKANAVEKLAYLQMIGYDISWTAFNIIEVMASTKFSEKRIGYLAAAQAFNDETDVLMLTTNLIRKDLQSSTNIYDIGTALNGLSCFVTTDLSRDLVNDIVNLLSSSRPYVRKKALLLLYKIFMKYPEALRSTFPRLRERLEDQDPGVQSAAVNVICELARKNPRNYIGLQNIFFKLLNTSSNNWMLIKIIKLFSSLVPYEPKLGRRLLEPLTNLINSTSAMSLLYECINTVIAILISISSEGPGDYTPSIQLCVQKLGVLIDDSDQNLKYLGLLAMGKILQTHPKAVQAHKDIVLRCLEDKDESIRLRALDLLYGMISKKNIMEIVRKLMEHLDAAEGSFYRDELLRRIVAICSHDGYKYITNFEWYISVLVELTKVQGTKHGTLIAEQIQDVAVRVQSVRHFAVSQMVLLVQNAQLLLQGNAVKRQNMADVLLAAAWICGEFGQHVNDVWTLLDAMLRLKLSIVPGALLSVYVQNMSKLYALQLCKFEAENDWDGVESLNNLLASKLPEFQFTDHLEAQERACNFMALLKFAMGKHAERQQIGATLAKYFEGELNPVAAKAQRKVPVPEGLNLEAWINEQEPDSADEEEENGSDIEGESSTEEAFHETPKIASHYGAENLPQHGKKQAESVRHGTNREQSPTSYHRTTGMEGNGTAKIGGEKKRGGHKKTAESQKKRREFEQNNNPFYVKERPSQMAASSSKLSQQFPRPKREPEFLQSPLEIEGVVGLEGYLAQKDATLSWKNVQKEGKRKKKQKAENGGNGKKMKKGRKKRPNGSDEEEMKSDEEEEEDGIHQREQQQQHFVYKGDGEMPEGALESSDDEEAKKLNDEFRTLDFVDMAYGDGDDVEETIKEIKKKKKRPSRESIRIGTGSLENAKEENINKNEKKKKRIKGKIEEGNDEAKDEQMVGNKLRKNKVKEGTVDGKPEKKVKKKKKALSKKASLRKEYASIDSPTGGTLVADENATTIENEGQLISFAET